MRKISKWINENKVLVVMISITVIIIPLIIVQLLFKFKAPCDPLVAAWEAGDLIGYFGDVLTFFGTIVLGYVAIIQSDNSNKLSHDLLKLEWRKQQPCFDIISNQTYKLYLDNEIEKYKLNFDYTKELYIEPLFLMSPRTGAEVSVALIEMLITNTGNSDIRNIFIQDMKFYLGQNSPKEQQKPIGIFGNQYIKKGETRKFIIDFHQEIDIYRKNHIEQLEWIKNDCSKIMPRMELILHIISVEGFMYEEKITIGCGWHAPLVNQGLILERIPNVTSMNIERIDTDK